MNHYSILLVAAGLLFTLTSPVHAQSWERMLRDREGFLWDKMQEIRRLEVTREQRRELIELKIDFELQAEELADQIEDLRKNRYKMVDGNWRPIEGANEKYREKIEGLQELAKEFKAKANEVLLPHQLELRKKVKIVDEARGQKLGPLVSMRLNEYLELSPAQRTKISSLVKDASDEMAVVLVKKFRETEKKVLKELTREQREKFEGLFGELEYGTPTRTASWLYFYEALFVKKPKD